MVDSVANDIVAVTNSNPMALAQLLTSDTTTCARCILRAFHTQPGPVFRHAQQDLENALAAAADPPLVSPRDAATQPTCVACMGIMQHDSYGTRDAVLRDDHELGPVRLDVHLPIMLPLRTAMFKKLIRLASNDTLSGISDCKEIIKDLMMMRDAAGIANLTVTTERDAMDLHLDAKFVFKEQDAEVRAIAEQLGVNVPRGNKRKRKRFNGGTGGVFGGPPKVHNDVITHKLIENVRDEMVNPYNEKELKDTGTTSNACKVTVTLRRAPIFISGNYLKLARGVSQTPWTIDDARQGGTSVSEEIERPLRKYFLGKSAGQLAASATSDGATASALPQSADGATADGPAADESTAGVADDGAEQQQKQDTTTEAEACFVKFHSAGREDIDVRMLGDGRPFMLEVINARPASLAPETVAEMASAINKSEYVNVKHLRMSSAQDFEELKAGEISKMKKYVCLISVSRTVTAAELKEKLDDVVNDLEVAQRTPLRVLHRRSLLIRPKVVHAVETEFLNDRWFILRLTTSAGTYVKEFVHGDMGRTEPNIGMLLGCDADILQLDVADVIMNA